MRTLLIIKKSRISLVIVLTLVFINCNAQLKLYPNGNLSIGSITQPPFNAELQIIGNTLFSNNTGVISSSAYIKGANNLSSATRPDYTWWGDTISGIFHPNVNTMAFSVGGRTVMMFSPGSNVVIDSSVDNGDRLQVNGGLNKNPFDLFSYTTSNSMYSGINWVNNSTTKAWAVKNGIQDEFFVYGNGQAYSYGWNTISDSTLKENVYQISNALEKVRRLQGVTYNLKSVNSYATGAKNVIVPPVRQMGLIAQAVERVVPEVVTTNDNGIKTIAYSNMVGLLIEAIKQEDSKINRLQHKLDSCIAINGSTNLFGGAKLFPCPSCPVNKDITFHCFVPTESKNASLLVFDMSGALKKTVTIAGKEKQLVNINRGELTAGMYYYCLMVDGNEIDTQKVILTQN